MAVHLRKKFVQAMGFTEDFAWSRYAQGLLAEHDMNSTVFVMV